MGLPVDTEGESGQIPALGEGGRGVAVPLALVSTGTELEGRRMPAKYWRWVKCFL